jgi:hypothetical protein
MLFTPPSDIYFQTLVAETTGGDAYENAVKQVHDHLHALADAAHLSRKLVSIGPCGDKRREQKNVHLSNVIECKVRHAIMTPTKLRLAPISPKTIAIAASEETIRESEKWWVVKTIARTDVKPRGWSQVTIARDDTFSSHLG